MISAKDFRAAGSLHAAHAEVVLNGDRYSKQWKLGICFRSALIDLFSALQRTRSIDLQKCIQRFVECFRGVKGIFDDCARSGVAIPNAFGRSLNIFWNIGHEIFSWRGLTTPLAALVA